MTREKTLFTSGGFLFMLNMAASAVNYLCQILLGRFFSVPAFGTINTIFSIVPIVTVPAAALSLIITRKTADSMALDNPEGASSYLSGVLSLLPPAALALALAGSGVLVPLKQLLGVQSNALLVSAVLLYSLTYILYFYNGALPGLGKFALMGLVALITPLAKLAGVALASLLPLDDYGQQTTVLFAMCAGTLLAVAIGQWGLRRSPVRLSLSLRAARGALGGLGGEYFYSLLANLALMFFMNIDIIAIRFVFGADEAGQYSSVQLFGRIIYYFTTSLVTVMLPMVASAKAAKNNALRVQLYTMGLVLLLSLVLFVPFVLLAEPLLGLLFGDKFLSAIPYIKYVYLVSLALSLNTIALHGLIGLEKIKFPAVFSLAGCVLTLGLLFFVPRTPQAFLLTIGLMGLATFVGNFAYLLVASRGRAATDAPTPPAQP